MKTVINIRQKRKKHQAGFSLLETLVTMTLFFFILYGVYMMVSHYGDVSQTEHSRIRMQQESRFMMGAFATEIKEAGAVLTIGDAGKGEGGNYYFNGILPLNKTGYPDGIIIATGDPDAFTSLVQPYNGGDTTLYVKSTKVQGYDPSKPAYEGGPRPWTRGDKGIVIGPKGYYVFSVESTTEETASVAYGTLTIRDTAVYYSGLLNTAADPLGSETYQDLAPTPGNSVIYGNGSLVCRLTNFSIFLFKQIVVPGRDRNVRQLIRVYDAKGDPNVLSVNSQADKSVITENIWDMQLAYVAYADFKTADRNTPIDPAHHYFAGTVDGQMTSTNLTDLLDDIRSLRLKQVDMNVVLITEELPGKGETRKEDRYIPPIGDQDYYYLPNGKYSHKLMSVSLILRNYYIGFYSGRRGV